MSDEFVQQSIPLASGGSLTVPGQKTPCTHLVITPTVGKHSAGGPLELLGGLSLTHTLTGRSIANRQYAAPLTELAERLSHFNWDFTDPDHFTKPENATEYEAVQTAWREWSMADAPGPTYYYGEPEDMQARREADPAGTMLGEQIEWWMKHSKALMDNTSGMPTYESNPEARRAEVALSCEGYSHIYLLAVLRAIDPKVADIAAQSLVGDLDAGDGLGEWIWQWHEELTAGKPLTLSGIPSGDLLADFITPADPGSVPAMGVKRYRKNPVEIEARQWHGTAEGATRIITWILEGGGTARYYAPGEWDDGDTDGTYIVIDTLEGRMLAGADDWIIRGVQGEHYPCKPTIFAATYTELGAQ